MMSPLAASPILASLASTPWRWLPPLGKLPGHDVPGCPGCSIHGMFPFTYLLHTAIRDMPRLIAGANRWHSEE
jgi:hypothetical protein